MSSPHLGEEGQDILSSDAASGPMPGSSRQTEDSSEPGDMLSGTERQDSFSSDAASGPLLGSSRQTEDISEPGDMLSGTERQDSFSSDAASGPLLGSSKQTEDISEPSNILSGANVANSLVRSIVGTNGQGFESQLAASTGPLSAGAIISQCYNPNTNRPESSESSGSSVAQNYGALSKGGIGIAYKILKDGDAGNSGVAGNILGSGMKLAENALTWPFELLDLAKNSAPLIVGYLLQYSLTLASVFSAGHIGKDELAAVSLATMTANLTGYAFYQAFSTALDTLCVQSYNSGMYTQVGLQFQRCVILLMLISVPIGYIWLSSPYILGYIVPDKKVAELAGGYLQILFLGAPGYALFEAGKKYMQVQGINHASAAVMAFLAPLNAFMNFALVWDGFLGLGFGFYGAPIAVVITNWLMPLGLAYYAIFIDGRKCWHPLTLRAFTNWGPLLSLALPNVAMIESEFLAVETLTLFSSFFGTSTLAAQSILATMMSFIYQIPFGMSVSSCTAVARYIGAGDIASARRSACVAIGIALVFGVVDYIVLISVREYIGMVFSSDDEVVAVVAEAIPVCAVFQAVDVLSGVTGGILRGQGRQYLAGMIQIPAYYGLALPISLYTSFKLGWGIRGLWAGCACALAVISIVQTAAVLLADWEKVMSEARDRIANENAEEVQEDLEDGVRERLLGFGGR